jgi:hypothetical protein
MSRDDLVPKNSHQYRLRLVHCREVAILHFLIDLETQGTSYARETDVSIDTLNKTHTFSAVNIE